MAILSHLIPFSGQDSLRAHTSMLISKTKQFIPFFNCYLSFKRTKYDNDKHEGSVIHSVKNIFLGGKTKLP